MCDARVRRTEAAGYGDEAVAGTGAGRHLQQEQLYHSATSLSHRAARQVLLQGNCRDSHESRWRVRIQI